MPDKNDNSTNNDNYYEITVKKMKWIPLRHFWETLNWYLKMSFNHNRCPEIPGHNNVLESGHI